MKIECTEDQKHMFDNYIYTIDSITEYIEKTEMVGTSRTESIAEVEINGVNYQIQLRFERDPNSFIHPGSGYEASCSGIRVILE